MEGAVSTRSAVKPPSGALSVKTDSNGRMKMPVRMAEYWGQLEDKRIFATVLNGMGRMYFNGSWERNLDLLKAWPKRRKALALAGGSSGQDLDVDETRRVTLPPVMRKELGLDNQQLYIQFHDDVALIYTEEMFGPAVAAAKQEVAEFYGEAEELGFV
jgi:DNA-binding transcriptional regulator/RsmH inhibitor MraZ